MIFNLTLWSHWWCHGGISGFISQKLQLRFYIWGEIEACAKHGFWKFPKKISIFDLWNRNRNLVCIRKMSRDPQIMIMLVSTLYDKHKTFPCMFPQNIVCMEKVLNISSGQISWQKNNTKTQAYSAKHQQFAIAFSIRFFCVYTHSQQMDNRYKTLQ